MGVYADYNGFRLKSTLIFVSVDDLEDPEENEKTLAFASVSLWVFSEVRGQRFAVPIPLANQLRDRDLAADEPDLQVMVIDKGNWYFGLDGRPESNQFDFVSVVLHEIAHGLGIVDSFKLDDDRNGQYGLKFIDEEERIPTWFDYFVRLGNGSRLITDLSRPPPLNWLRRSLASNSFGRGHKRGEPTVVEPQLCSGPRRSLPKAVASPIWTSTLTLLGRSTP